ncbi:hypothetical protein [Desulfonatronovibrio hydrogenovorans]|uniref:hypothetical protein n=1 Tax=Desulfonatronovibrio hydrogenovorans TaxID=53245 RepID=UPI0004906621|nr:hypothetical protein [Desulfonatronovibrio hydrogenovorans]
MQEDNNQSNQKKAMYDSLSPRRKKFIDRIGYDKWDPFQEPKNPIDIRTDTTRRTSKQLMRDFLYECKPEEYSNAYGRGVLEMCLGIINGDDKCRAMYEFSLWYRDLLEREKKEFKTGL